MNAPIKHELPNGTIEWRLPNGLYHREDGPAVIDQYNAKFWFFNGKRHCTTGPAIVFDFSTQCWYQHGKLHRTDGPAIIYSDGTARYWLDGEEYDPVTFLIKSYEYTNQT